jgi:predicted negative regulator of RcsB-dependent stress response
MTEIKEPFHLEAEKNPVANVQQFWTKNNKPITYALTALVLVLAAYFGYKYYVQIPNENKAYEAMFHAEDYYRADSARLALQGDNVNAGFLKIMSRYKGTKAANLAAFYAGSCYLKLKDYNNAVKYLKEFSTPALQLQARAYGLLGDAYSELNKRDEAVESYKKAGTIFEKDDLLSPEYLFRAGYLYEAMGKNKEAVDMYKIIKEKYPTSQRGFDIDKYLARLGDVK